MPEKNLADDLNVLIIRKKLELKRERERESKIRVKLKLVPGLTGSHNLHTLISLSSVPVAVFKYRLVTASLSLASFCVTALLGQIC